MPLGASPAQFGCLDAIEDEAVFDALLKPPKPGCASAAPGLIHGPFSPSINSEVGMLVEGFEPTPMIFMPWNPPYLPAMLESRGYAQGTRPHLLSLRHLRQV